jgi:hypothetical protein
VNGSIVLVGLGLWWCLHGSPVPEVRVEQAAEVQSNFTFKGLKPALLFPPASGSPQRRLVLVAASGGGTRAALFTASALRGLHRLGALGDVKLLSGVSGGSAAMAYLAIHYDALVRHPTEPAWDDYLETMAVPFIDDVIRGGAEFRLLRGTRLGTLLAESFERHMGVTGCKDLPTTLGQAEVGLIFNTTLAGESTIQTATGQWGPANCDGAGGRLIFTNLCDRDAFPKDGYKPGLDTEVLAYIQLCDRSLPLTSAAALSANFPPVFSNSLVEVPDQKYQYWVTDGGASENRGLVSLLFALRHALETLPRNLIQGALPEIHIVTIEASGTAIDFSQDRGISPALAASEQYARQLADELLEQIRRLYTDAGGKRDDFHVHFLPMPYVFRARGGVATHWMLPRYVQLTDISADDPNKAKRIELAGETVKQLILDLHLDPADPKRGKGYAATDKAKMKEVWEWIKKDDHQENRWPEIVDKLGKKK